MGSIHEYTSNKKCEKGMLGFNNRIKLVIKQLLLFYYILKHMLTDYKVAMYKNKFIINNIVKLCILAPV